MSPNKVDKQSEQSSSVELENVSQQPWLNSIDCVNQIVREFAAGFVYRYGIVDHQLFMRWLADECDSMNALFFGNGTESGKFQMDSWNSPQHLGRHLTQAMGIEGELELAVRDAFMIFAAKLGELMRENQTPATEARLKQALDLLVDGFIEKLLGRG